MHNFYFLIFWGWVQLSPCELGLTQPTRPGYWAKPVTRLGPNQQEARVEYLHACMHSPKVINLPSHCAMLLSKWGKEKQKEKLASLFCRRRWRRQWCSSWVIGRHLARDPFQTSLLFFLLCFFGCYWLGVVKLETNGQTDQRRQLLCFLIACTLGTEIKQSTLVLALLDLLSFFFCIFSSSFSRFFLLCFFRPFFGHWSSLPPYFLPFVLCVSWVFLPPPCSSVVLDIYGARLALRLGCVLLKMHFAAVWLIEKLIYCLLGPT